MELQATVVNKYLEKITDFGFEYVPKLIHISTVYWFMDYQLITKGVKKSLGNSKIDQSLVPFLTSITNIILKILVAITVMGMVGIEMTSFIAIIGAAGLAIGLALSGTLQNFAGGVIILILKPFKLEILLMLKAIQEL
jgi:small conductance mechanosensitive channel